MTSQNIKQIWQPATGITDIETDWRTIGASEIESIQKIWSEQRARLKGTKQPSEEGPAALVLGPGPGLTV